MCYLENVLRKFLLKSFYSLPYSIFLHCLRMLQVILIFFILREQAGRPKCPLDPFFIMPDKCHCVDFQVLKLQELPDHIPQGEMPRHLQLYCDRYLCDRVVPGNRVLILGIYSIKKVSKTGGKSANKEKALVGVRAPYIRVLGISVDGENTNIGIYNMV